MTTDQLMQASSSTCDNYGTGEEFDVDSFLMSAVDWQGSSQADDLLSCLIDGTDPNLLLSTSCDGSGFSGGNWMMEQTSPSSAASDEGGGSGYSSFSPHCDHTISSTNTSVEVPSTHCQALPQDVHIDVELGNEAESKSSCSTFVSVEEREMLSKEGISIPYDLPLTKSEEKHVKRVRRKIKNKQSAADSRRKKKEYVDGLERRVEKCTEMNSNLLKKMKLLESENKSLIEQLKGLQAYVAQFNPSKLQAGSFMMIVILSFSLLIVPQVYKPHNIRSSLSHSRSLLDVPSDEFGNILSSSDNGFVGISQDKLTPVLPLPWKYQSPALQPWNSSTKKNVL